MSAATGWTLWAVAVGTLLYGLCAAAFAEERIRAAARSKADLREQDGEGDRA